MSCSAGLCHGSAERNLPEAALIRDRIPWTAEEDRDVYCDRCGLPDSDADRWHDFRSGEVVITFYICNEALSLLENAAVFVPIPERLKDVLLQLRDSDKEEE